LDLDLGKPGALLELKSEFVQADTGLFIKAGVVRADPCCVFESACALDVDPSTQTLQTKGSSREFSVRKLGELRKFGEVSSVGAWLTSVAIPIPTSQRFMISWVSRLLSQSLMLSQGSMPFQTLLLSRLLTVLQMPMFSRV
jgi:hypothetical protein